MSAPLRFSPMSLAVLDEPFDHGGFIFELKYDGFRALAHLDSGRCREAKVRSLPEFSRVLSMMSC